MELLTLRSSSRVSLLLHLPCLHKRSFRLSGVSRFPQSRCRSSPFPVFCGVPSGKDPQTPSFRLRLLPVLRRSFCDFLSCRSRISRLCLTGGLDGDGIDGKRLVRGGGGLGTLLLSTTAAAVSRARASPFLGILAANPTFVSGLVAWALAQTMKVFLNFFVERRWDLGMLFNSGGMPSSHAALCTALTASVALCHGVGDALFSVCLGFSLIVMYDATGVRRHAGMQAAVLNMIVEDLFQGHPISQRKLKELLGHTPSQVFAGAVLGVLVAWICCQDMDVDMDTATEALTNAGQHWLWPASATPTSVSLH